jgi:hypothetical protein
MVETVQKKLIIGELKGTARPTKIMRGILGANTRERAVREWQEFYGGVVCSNLRALVDNGTISRKQYARVVKVVTEGLKQLK